jgi:putative ABC transport system substrate-binding protein
LATGSTMKTPRLVLVVTLTVGLVAAPLVARAQPTGKVPRIGYLAVSPGSAGSPLIEAFRKGLRDLGYVEGQTVVIQYGWAEGPEQLPARAAELVRLQLDVIFAPTTPAALAAQQATRTTPIVVATAADPVGAGLVAGLAAPGSNVTGLSLFAPELVAKQLQLLKEAVPKASRVAVLSNPAHPNTPLMVKETEAAARSLGMRVQLLGVRGVDAFDMAFSAVTKGRASVLFVLFDPFLVGQRARIVEFANEHRLPAMYPHREYAEAGGLMAYGADIRENFRRAATYVHKILAGAKPADLPVEQPAKFQLVINQRTAKALGLTIPPAVLARADEVIQ